MKNKLMLNKSKGFTLIELLVVIAIIGILAVVVLSALNSARKSARDAKKKENVNSVMTAMETYATTNNDKYPTSENDLINAGIFPNGLPEDITVDWALAPDDFCASAELEVTTSGAYFKATPLGANTSDTGC